jgi:hypothetical protein
MSFLQSLYNIEGVLFQNTFEDVKNIEQKKQYRNVFLMI